MVEKLNLNIKINENKLIAFLNKSDLTYDYNVDLCLVIKNNQDIVACACRKQNVFKMIAVDPQYQSLDYVAKLISELISISHAQNIYHYFIFTKADYFNHFINIGFKLLVSFDNIGLLEYGNLSFDNYYLNHQLSSESNNGAIVMNCNPFTNGHRYLIETASKLVDQLVVFIVEENKSFFSFEDRLSLVKKGCADLDNVTIIPSGPYIISQATFPSYFLKEIDDKTYYYTNLDLLLFKKIMVQMNIKTRFFGAEPNDELTNFYLKQASVVLENQIHIFERISYNSDIISASLVRKYLKDQAFDKIEPLVNNITYQYLIDNFRKE